MPRIVWCNLDPAWPFARLLRDHCIDWILRDDVRIWDVRQPAGATQSPWDDWPAQIAPQALADAMDELPTAPPEGRLVAFHLPRTFAADDATGAVLASCARRLSELPGWTLMLSVPEQTEIAPFQADGFGATLIARLGDDPRCRIRSQRLLIEMMLDPVLVEDLRRPGGLAILDLSLESEDRAPFRDRIAEQWNAAVPEVLRQIEALKQPAAGQGGQDEQIITQTLSGVPRLRGDATTRETGTPAPRLEIRAPAYLDPRFADRLHRARDDVLRQLDAEMSARWQRLEQWRAQLLAECRNEDERLDDTLAKVGVMDLGFSDRGRDCLDTWGKQLANELRETADGSESIARRIGRDIRLPGRDAGVGYVRHRFEEDEDFDQSIEAAIRAGGRLIRRSRLVSGWLLITLAAAVPVLMMRLPAWIDSSLTTAGALPSGLRDYLATPSLWLFDSGWTLLPGLLLWIAGLAAARRRRLDLKDALHQAQLRAESLWQRHAGVLDNMERYVRHTAAMRRLMLLRVHLGRLDRGVRAGRAALEAMTSELERQRRDYDTIGVPRTPPPPRLDDALAGAIRQDASPLRWLRVLVSRLETGPLQRVRIRDDRMAQPGVLRSGYPVGDATLRLQRVTPP